MNVIPIISAALATALLSGCYATVPPIAQGGPREVALVTPYFDDQVKQRFPVGSDEKQLRAELHRESFKIRETNDPNLGYQYAATFEDSGICKTLWTVRWCYERSRYRHF